MKNLSLILNGVLLVAVGVLYYMEFSEPSEDTAGSASGNIKDLKIAYISADSILKNYEYVKVNRDKLEAKGKRLDQDIKNRAASLQADYEAYQRNAGNMTPNQFRAAEEDLGKKRQNLQLYQESLSQELMVDQENLTKDLYKRITAFLKTYGEKNDIKVVLKFDAASDLLYVADSLDISQIVVKGLNDQYRQEQGLPQDKKDSAAVKK